MENKIGIGYITCDSKSRVERTFPSLLQSSIQTELVVVNSGCIHPEILFDGADKIIQTGKKESVAISRTKPFII